MDLDEAVCARCGQPLGPRANWRVLNEGRAYHNDCEPAPPPERQVQPESLTKHARRTALRVIHGEGQQTLEGDDALD